MKNRDVNLDIIRTVAIFNVIGVHYLSHIGYYEGPQVSVCGYILALFRAVFITCVPLFLLLSGFLCNEKKLNLYYYLGITRIILTYFMAGAICQGFKYAITGEGTIRSVILSFFLFDAAPYGWYIAMYIGLFMLIPFINVLWNTLDLGSKNLFIISMLILTALLCITNGLDLNNTNFWQGTKDSYTQILPEYFVGLYPVTYYVIGCYLKEKSESIKKWNIWKVVCGIIVSIFLVGTFNFLKNYGIAFPWAKDTSYGSFQSTIIATLIFCLLLKVKVNNELVVEIVTVFSRYSLSIYLLSYIVDTGYYHLYSQIANTNMLKLVGYIPSVITILSLTLLIAIPFDLFVSRTSQFVNGKIDKNLSKALGN